MFQTNSFLLHSSIVCIQYTMYEYIHLKCVMSERETTMRCVCTARYGLAMNWLNRTTSQVNLSDSLATRPQNVRCWLVTSTTDEVRSGLSLKLNCIGCVVVVWCETVSFKRTRNASISAVDGVGVVVGNIVTSLGRVIPEDYCKSFHECVCG